MTAQAESCALTDRCAPPSWSQEAITLSIPGNPRNSGPRKLSDFWSLEALTLLVLETPFGWSVSNFIQILSGMANLPVPLGHRTTWAGL